LVVPGKSKTILAGLAMLKLEAVQQNLLQTDLEHRTAAALLRHFVLFNFVADLQPSGRGWPEY
jgi:hypothetical protein